MEKMPKSSTRDYVSSLPDAVLLYILSFLNVEEVVRTSVLSKRWQYIWTSVPTLTFVCPINNGNSKFEKRVNKALLCFQQTRIEKFKIDYPSGTSDPFSSLIDNWAQFAADKKVRDLSFHFNEHDSYDLSRSVCCNSSLANLSLRGFYFPRGACISWPSLKSLSLEFVNGYKDTARNILCGCPMLEYLKMINCSVFDTTLSIESETLREVVIEGDKEIEFTSLRISAPNLRTLHFLGDDIICNQFQQVIVPSLVTAKLDFTHPLSRHCDDFLEFLGSISNVKELEHQVSRHYDNFVGFLESISNVKELELEGCFTECLSYSMIVPSATALTLQFPCLTCLKVSISMSLHVLSLVALLKCSPNLETLHVHWSQHSERFPIVTRQAEEYFWSKSKNFPLPHLKTEV